MTFDRRLIISETNDSGTFNLFIGERPTEVFVDGIGQLAIGPAVTKLNLYSVIDSEIKDGKIREDRLITSVLVIPTISLFQFLQSLKSTMDPVLPMLDEQMQKTIQALKNMKL